MYEKQLLPLLHFVQAHPGLSEAALRRAIQQRPWPPGTCAAGHQFEGTRMDPDWPAASNIKWKLRYLELAGDVQCKRGKWFVAQ